MAKDDTTDEENLIVSKSTENGITTTTYKDGSIHRTGYVERENKKKKLEAQKTADSGNDPEKDDDDDRRYDLSGVHDRTYFVENGIIPFASGETDVERQNQLNRERVDSHNRSANQSSSGGSTRGSQRSSSNRPVVGNWCDSLEMEKLSKGGYRVLTNQHNVARALELCPTFEGRIRFNTLSYTVELRYPVELDRNVQSVIDRMEEQDRNGYLRKYDRDVWYPIDDMLISAIGRHFYDDWKFPPSAGSLNLVFSKTTINDALMEVGRSLMFDPVLAYYQNTQWDGVQRVETALSVMLGVPQSEYLKIVSRVLFLSIAARQIEPGCKADIMIILEGAQGVEKSTAAKWIFPNQDWFTDSISSFEDKDAKMSIIGKIVIEVAELNALLKSKSEHAKAFLSTAVDKFREPYARNESAHPRRCILIGTTNLHEYMNDPTGLRRFLPVHVPVKLNFANWIAIREQVHAESYERVKEFVKMDALERKLAARTGHSGMWWLSEDEEELTVPEVSKRQRKDMLGDYVRELLLFYPDGTVRDRVLDMVRREDVVEVLKSKMPAGEHVSNSRVETLLTKIGFERPKFPIRQERENWVRQPMMLEANKRWWTMKQDVKDALSSELNEMKMVGDDSIPI